MKPEFSKPFNLTDARKGAPYGCKDGQQVEILKWDASHKRYILIGIVCENGYHYPESWTESGVQAHDEEIERRSGRDLVMMPLGFIDGKPVFVGDKFLWLGGKLTTASPDMAGGDWSSSKWPEPEKVYPKSQQTDEDLVSNYFGGAPVAKDQEYEAWRRIADATLRHAIDKGQVITNEDHEAALIRLGEQLKGVALANRAARDMAVARAIENTYCDLVPHKTRNSDNYLLQIISTVK